MTETREQRYARLLATRELYRRDFALYAREQLWIETKVAGQIETLDIAKKPLQTMVWRKCQDQLADLGYIDGNIIKGRQQGSSTESQGLMFWKASLNRNYNTLLIAQDDPTTKAIFSKAQFFFEHLEPAYKPLIRKSNRSELHFAAAEHKRQVKDHGLGSRMDFANAEHMLAGTGTTKQGLHLSECAKWRTEEIDILLASVYPILYRGPGSIRLKESTAHIGGQWFRECCEAARDGETDEFLVFCPAYLEPDNRIRLNPKRNPDDKYLARMVGLDPEEQHIVKVAKRGQPKYDIPPFEIPPEYIKFRRTMIAQPGWDEDLFMQEYPTEFESAWISRDSRVFNHQKLFEQKDRNVRNPLRLCRIVAGGKMVDDPNMRMGPENDYLAFWEEPMLGEDYDIGADVASGIEDGDYSTAIVWKRRTREQVAEYHMHIDPSDFGTQLFWLGGYFFNAQVTVEWTGGYGITTDTQLKRLNYPNIGFWKHRDQIVPIPTKKTGWQTTRESKAYLVSYFRHFLNHDQVTIRSICLLNEMFRFIQLPFGDGYEYRSETGNDDLVIGGGIGLVTGDDENQHRLDEVAPIVEAKPIGDISVVDNYDPRNPPRRNNFAREIRGNYDG